MEKTYYPDSDTELSRDSRIAELMITATMTKKSTYSEKNYYYLKNKIKKKSKSSSLTAKNISLK